LSSNSSGGGIGVNQRIEDGCKKPSVLYDCTGNGRIWRITDLYIMDGQKDREMAGKIPFLS